MGFDTPTTDQFEANVPDWSEDGNSPVTASAAADLSITLADTFDLVWVHAHDLRGDSSTTQRLELQANGNTGTNYSYVSMDGTRTTSDTAVEVVGAAANPQNTSVTGGLVIAGRWSNRLSGRSQLGTDTSAAADGFRVLDVTSPLDSLTFQWGGSANISGTVSVYGRDL